MDSTQISHVHTELTLEQIDADTLIPVVRYFDADGNQDVRWLRDVRPAKLRLDVEYRRETVLPSRGKAA